MNFIDKVSIWLARVAAWLFVATGAMLTYEVLARYVFNAPTIWAAELSQLVMMVGFFIALAGTLHSREHISIDILHNALPMKMKRMADTFVLLFIAIFSGIVSWWGFDIAWDSFINTRSTGTMLNLPNWWIEVFVPVGFFLVCLQSFVEIVKIWAGKEWGKAVSAEDRQQST